MVCFAFSENTGAGSFPFSWSSSQTGKRRRQQSSSERWVAFFFFFSFCLLSFLPSLTLVLCLPFFASFLFVCILLTLSTRVEKQYMCLSILRKDSVYTSSTHLSSFVYTHTLYRPPFSNPPSPSATVWFSRLTRQTLWRRLPRSFLSHNSLFPSILL